MQTILTMKASDRIEPLSGNPGSLPACNEQFESLWSKARVRLGSYLACFLPSRSMIEDCLQEVALISWQKAPKERGDDEFLAYCMGCAKRVAKEAIRKQRIGKLHFLAPDVAEALAETIGQRGPTAVEADERIVVLRRCVEKLDVRQRAIVDARYERDETESLKQEAERRQQSLDSLYKQLERIRTALRNCVVRNLARDT